MKFKYFLTLFALFLPGGFLAACSKPQAEKTPTCVRGRLVCQDSSSYKLCLGDKGWADGKCRDDQVCAGHACRDIICEPGKLYCSSDNINAIRCDSTGTTYNIEDNCAASKNGLCIGAGTCVNLCEPGGKSYIGCEYFAVDLDNAFVPGHGRRYLDAPGAQFAVVVSNTDNNRDAYVAVTTRDDPVDSAIVPPQGIHTFNLPRRDVNGTVLGPLAYRISSNVPINAYQFNPLENEDVYSNDASLLLPTHTLGTFHVVMTREQTFKDLKGYVTVVATTPGETEVTVTVSAPTLAGNGIPALKAGESFTATLLRFDVLNIETNEIGADLTGSTVKSSQPVAVFGGSEAANAPNTNHCGSDGHCEYDGKTICTSNADCSQFITCCADHLEQQLYPTSAWGKHYVVARSSPRGMEADYVRILAVSDDTLVETSPAIGSCALNRGDWCEFEVFGDVEILATAPILVGQFLAAEQAPNPNIYGGMEEGDAAIGDPAFMLSVPVEQYRSEYVFLAPNKYAEDYVNIILPADAEAALDNQLIPNELFENIGAGSNFKAGRFPIADGFHNVVLSKPGSIIVYGYDRYVSYGYPGGLNLNTLTGQDEEE